MITAPWYVCGTCGEQRRSGAYAITPRCPRNWLHGLMVRERDVSERSWASRMDQADQLEVIVRKLAERSPVVRLLSGPWCPICERIVRHEATDHEQGCPRRLAVEWTDRHVQ